MKKKLFGFLRTNRQGIALITVLGVVTLATILILALFSASDTEFKSSRSYAEGAESRLLADNAVNLVVSQIQSAAAPDPTLFPPPTIWASQPGAVRTYLANGSFAQGRKLYSDDEMVMSKGGIADESEMASDRPDTDWDLKPAGWVDLNRPVARVVGGGGAALYFPILDPRAALAAPGYLPVEGFSFAGDDGHGKSVNGVQSIASTANPDALRVPMPVMWLYQLRDGTFGTVDQPATGGQSPQPGVWNAVAGAGVPSDDNPIIGRIAFWTDDESCRVNVNTAGEPGFWGLPVVFGKRDQNWVDSPPAVFEYQRYPGHPATVALSSVLSPNATQDPNVYDSDTFRVNFPAPYEKLKNDIYQLAPRITSGGSDDGQNVFDIDDFSKKVGENTDTLWANIRKAKSERLYPSVDEMIFRQFLGGQGVRTAVSDPGAGAAASTLVTPAVLQRARFFLSANSRAPETNMYGLPRVAIWPVPDQSLDPKKYYTAFDTGIAKAATLGSNVNNTYYFSRRDYASSLTDIGRDEQTTGLKRNAVLMTYLDTLIGAIMPGGSSFKSKYGLQDSRQILINIFDYIRSTNLYDAYLDYNLYGDKTGKGGEKKRPVLDDDNDSLTSKYGAKRITDQRELWRTLRREFGTKSPYSFYTYTPPRFGVVRRVQDVPNRVTAREKEYYDDGGEEPVLTGSWPGHGQVAPSEWQIGGQTYKGMGRFPTISEVALHFICTGDGKHDEGSHWIKVGDNKIYSGGKTAQRINTGAENHRFALEPDDTANGTKPYKPAGMWYSNFPPFPSRATFEKWGCSWTQLGSDGPRDPLQHPAMNSTNWNCTLEYKETEGGIPLEEDEKRIQIAMEFELFVPQMGFTKYCPDFTLVVNGSQLGALQVQDGQGKWRSIFDTTQDQVIQSSAAYNGSSMLGESGHDNGVTPMGGTYGLTPLMTGRQAKTVGKMPKDAGYQTGASSDIDGAMLNYPLVSSFFTIKRDPTQKIPFRSSGGALQVDIYPSHDWQGKSKRRPVQTVNITIPDGETPKPWLVTYSSERIRFQNSNGGETKHDAVNAVRWWAFNDGGAVGRYEGFGIPGKDGLSWANVREIDASRVGNTDANNASTFGRFHGGRNTASVPSKDPFNDKTNGGRVAAAGLIFGFANTTDFGGVPNYGDVAGDADYFRPDGPNMGEYKFYGTDSLRSVVPSHGDYRILASKRVVPASVWVPHRLWNTNQLFAHSITGNRYGTEVGADQGGATGFDVSAENRMVQLPGTQKSQGVWYPDGQVPDTPLTDAAAKKSNRYRDFDNGPGDMRDGAYTNKADDGNLSVAKFWMAKGNQGAFYKSRNAYFMSSYLQMPASNAFFTPNRMMSSPVMFGSLPTGVWGSLPPAGDSDAATAGVAWRTLLFRPDIGGSGGIHPGAPASAGGVSPADHLFLDLFWMPIVEPYAISSNYSSAGKINLNFQMLPFGHIKRTTALHAALKGEMVSAFSSKDVFRASSAPSRENPAVYKLFRDDNPILKQPNEVPRRFWDPETDKKDWHRAINRYRTIEQLERRFNFEGDVPAAMGGLLRTASQLCEIHLVPVNSQYNTQEPVVADVKDNANAKPAPMTFGALLNGMQAFWNHNNLTGDNTRESPYANLYQKVTTRSNTYRVYFKVQTIRKSRKVPADQVDETNDTMGAEYQGSALIERYLDFDSLDPAKVDYAADPFGKPSLEGYYRYRVLELKQFAP